MIGNVSNTDQQPQRIPYGASAARQAVRGRKTMITLFIFGIICCFLNKDETAEIAINACRAVQA